MSGVEQCNVVPNVLCIDESQAKLLNADIVQSLAYMLQAGHPPSNLHLLFSVIAGHGRCIC